MAQETFKFIEPKHLLKGKVGVFLSKLIGPVAVLLRLISVRPAAINWSLGRSCEREQLDWMARGVTQCLVPGYLISVFTSSRCPSSFRELQFLLDNVAI